MFRLVSLILCTCLFTSHVNADSPVPDRRQVITLNKDFLGTDLDPLFDTTQEACRTACLANAACVAYTFNSRNNSCFPKSDVRGLEDYEGAISANVFANDPGIIAAAPDRAEELDFLRQSDLNGALVLANGIGARHPGGQWGVEPMLDAARARERDGDTLNAMRWLGAVVARSDDAGHWVDYARLSLQIETENTAQRNRYQQQALDASVNAYLRATSAPVRINALLQMANALEARNRGRDMVYALRLAERLQPRADVLAALEAAIPKYGFRITEHRSDNESAAPRICATFSEPLVKAGVDYTPFVRLSDAGLVVQAEEREICIDGVQHGARYVLTFRKGLPAKSGEALFQDVEIAVYVRDRAPKASFPGRAYVLPKSADAALPIETVNVDEVGLTLRRVSDRNLLRAMQEDFFGRPLGYYDEQAFEADIAEEVWRGTGEVGNSLNQTMTTRLPLGEALADQPPGIYALSASVEGADPFETPSATQWFVLTDLGMTTMKGTDGLHVFVRGLGDAQALEGVELTLLSRANGELGTMRTDANGHALFEPGLVRGTASAAPAMVLATLGEQDMAFLSLTDPAFDLSDRGVEGREAAPPVDVFLSTDRGAYRPGEVIHLTALARDGVARAIPDLPLTAILSRPDGVEYSRQFSAQDSAGGHVFELPVAASAPRGAWRIEVKADVEAEALATQTVLVEDFLPERIDFEMALPEGDLRPGMQTRVTVDANYLFGAPGAGLVVEGSVILRPKRVLDAFPGYSFGRHDAQVSALTDFIEPGVTGSDGRTDLPLSLPEIREPDRPYEATVRMRVKEGSGRPVEREITRMLSPAGPMIGLKPGFDGVVPEGSEARFLVQALGTDLAPTPMQVKWTVNRVNTRYQWYQEYGSWNWEPVTTRSRVATGEATLGADPLALAAPVEWGQYELIVERLDGPYVAASSSFYAGWYAPADATSTPDTLELSLDQDGYRPGDEAMLRIVPRYAGTALVTVMSNRVIDMQAVEVSEGENLIPLTVTDDWGAGAYVTAQVIRPMNVAAGQNPARSLGLSYATVEPGEKALAVSVSAPQVSDPRGPLTAQVQVDGITEGETAYVTLAAVDLGILNLTGFETPDPSAHYFGQRRLGVELRDLYGRLIDGMSGAQGQVRSGGDALGAGFDSPPPTEELVAFFSGLLTVGPDGMAEATFDIPDFNGTVRLMAVAWSPTAVGQAEADVLVRDPVVVTATLPRFLAPGDESRLLLEITHAEGATGRVGLDVSASGLSLSGTVPSGFDISEGETVRFSLPIQAGEVGDHELRVALTAPGGQQLTKDLTLGVRNNDPEVAETRRFTLAAGDTFTLDQSVFAAYREGSASAILAAGPLAKLNAPGLLSALDRYPYGCTEQVTSQAMPLLYFSSVADALGLSESKTVDERIEQAVARILSRQASGGSFGLWYASSGDFWLDAYVTDFLSRARAKGHEVPDTAFTMAMDNLRNRINYAPDFDEGGEDVAYALMVLAREGAARMGDLRYFADVKAEAFGTPLALAQLGAALASYGDQTRADRMFRLAMARVSGAQPEEAQLWRADYGTRLRDRAGLLALAVAAGSMSVNASALTDMLVEAGPHMSTQEQVWTLLAIQALIDDPRSDGLTLNGEAVSGPLVRKLDADGMEPQALGNISDRSVDITLTTLGVPQVAPDAGGYGYAIARQYYDMEGNSVSLERVETGTRMVVVLTITPFETGEARLMVNDPLPAGLEIDNPNLLRSGDVRALGWLDPAYATYSEARSDRFLAAVDWRSDTAFDLAYIVRAVSPGSYHHPAASVEDMYRPQYRARSGTGRMEVTE